MNASITPNCGMAGGVCVIACVLFSCDASVNSTSNSSIDAGRVSLLQLHRESSPELQFLPPSIPHGAQLSDFSPNLPLMVRIDELTDSGATLRTMATFTHEGWPNRQQMRVNGAGSSNVVHEREGDGDAPSHYLAQWRIESGPLDGEHRYRVHVLVPAKGGHTRELGYIDMQVQAASRQFRTAQVAKFESFTEGVVLPIKFRVGLRAVDKDADGVEDWRDNCTVVANPDQTDTLGNGVGDACRCANISCPPRDSCHNAGVCEPTSGKCTEPLVPDGTACPMAHADAACWGGVCKLTSCQLDYGDCNSHKAGCETLLTSSHNCGACGAVCPNGPSTRAVCRVGQCRLRCSSGYGDCDGDVSNDCETNFDSDPLNCGACGHSCLNGQTCVHAVCTAAACPANFADCDQDASNGCEAAILNNAQNCGTCGTACNLAHAAATCSDGNCAIAACSDGWADCNAEPADGCETDLLTSAENCGACGGLCGASHATAVCVSGACAISACDPGYLDCDGRAANGCEVGSSSDAWNCGACGNICTAVNASTDCVEGNCQLSSCNSGWADCNGLQQDGCESLLIDDVANCGTCGNACPGAEHALVACMAGTCGWSCEQYYADCDRDPSNGCETELAANCGACDNLCTAPHASGKCVEGACIVEKCSVGYGDCDGLSANGCEANLATDLNNCGSCDAACAIPNAVTACIDGMCAVAGCESMHGDCDNDPSNGCETDLNSDRDNCEFCGRKCLDGESCRLAMCQCDGPICSVSRQCCPAPKTCAAGICYDIMNDPSNCGQVFHSCSGACVQGQCVDIWSDPLNCGAVGRACEPYGVCEWGTCVYLNEQACGAPGVACPPNSICVGGACYCRPMLIYMPCNGVCLDMDADPNNCGACGNVCAIEESCINGRCAMM